MNYLARPYPVTIPHGLRRWLSGKKICANAEAAGDACSIPVSARSPGKAMATHACLENPWTEEPGRLQSTGSRRVGLDLETKPPLSIRWLGVKNLPAICSKPQERCCLWVGNILRSRPWQPTPVFSPGESQGQRGLAGYSPWGREESDTTEVT